MLADVSNTVEGIKDRFLMDSRKHSNDFRQHILYYYNHFACFYDLGEFIRRGTRRKVLRLSGWQPEEKVLDVCTGTGEVALTFARQGAIVKGVDLARGMLKRAITKSLGANPTWMEMDATDLCFRDKSFDISTISLALHHMPQLIQIRVLQEMRRVTRRLIVIIEPHVPFNARLWAVWAKIAPLIDESEYMHEWVRQDFPNTCHSAGLKVEFAMVTTLGLHRITLCSPE